MFTQAEAKSYYDARHKSVILKTNNFIYIQLHHSYTIPNLKNQKLSNQWVDLFQILQQIEILIYKLDLSLTMQIHSVILIVQLKLMTKKDDSYKWTADFSSSLIVNKNDDSSSHKIE